MLAHDRLGDVRMVSGKLEVIVVGSRRKIVSIVLVGLAVVAGAGLLWPGSRNAPLSHQQVDASPADEVVEAAIDAALSTPTSSLPSLPVPPLLSKRSGAVGAQLAEVAPKVFFGFTQNSKGEQLVRSGAVAARRLGDGRLVDLVLPESFPWYMTFNGTDVFVLGNEGLWKAPLASVQSGSATWLLIRSPGAHEDPRQPGVPRGTAEYSYEPSAFWRSINCWKLTCAWSSTQTVLPGNDMYTALASIFVSADGFLTDDYMGGANKRAYAGLGIATLGGFDGWSDGFGKVARSRGGQLAAAHWSGTKAKFVGVAGDGTIRAFEFLVEQGTEISKPSLPGELLDYLELEDGTPMYLYRADPEQGVSGPKPYIVRRGTAQVATFSTELFTPTFGPYSGGGFVTVTPDSTQSYTLASSHDDGRTWNTASARSVDVVAK